MKTAHVDKGNKGVFTISSDGEQIAELIYSMEGDRLMLIEHVEVEPSHRGGGIGSAAVKTAADYARENGLKVRPLCYFARVTMRSESYKDIVEA